MAKAKGTSPTALKGDVGHSKALSKGGSGSLNNLFLQDSSQNRSFSRTAKGAMKSELSKKEKSRKLTAASQRKK